MTELLLERLLAEFEAVPAMDSEGEWELSIGFGPCYITDNKKKRYTTSLGGLER